MKKIILILFLSGLSLNTFSQIQTTGFLTLSSGLCVPVGAYGKSNLKDSTAGYATQGYIIQPSLGINFNKYYGIIIQYISQSNRIDEKAFLAPAIKQFPRLDWTITSTKWFVKGPFAGLFFSNVINDRVNFESRFSLGYLQCISPEVELKAANSTSSANAKLAATIANSFGYSIGGGIKARTGNSFIFTINADYMSTKPYFKNVIIKNTKGVPTEVYNAYQPISSINVTLGIGFLFLKSEKTNN